MGNNVSVVTSIAFLINYVACVHHYFSWDCFRSHSIRKASYCRILLSGLRYMYDFNVRMPVAYMTSRSFLFFLFLFSFFLCCFLGGFTHITGQEIHDSETIITEMSMQARPRVQCGN